MSEFSDPTDAATEVEQAQRDAAIRNATGKHREFKPNGKCHYCHEVVGEGMRFCDVYCRDALDAEMAAFQRNHGFRRY